MMDDVGKDELVCKTNMDVVEKLLKIIDNWREVIIPRHVKFVDSYFRHNKNLDLVGDEFYFTRVDILFIFWRIQKTLQGEYCRRVILGDISKRVYFYRTKEIPKKRQVIQAEPKLKSKPKSNIYYFKEKGLN